MHIFQLLFKHLFFLYFLSFFYIRHSFYIFQNSMNFIQKINSILFQQQDKNYIQQTMLRNTQKKLNVKFYQIPTYLQQIQTKQQINNQNQNQSIKLCGLESEDNTNINLQIIFQYSQRNVLMAQQLLIQPNYQPPNCQQNNLKQSRQIEAVSPRVPRPFFANPSFQELQKQKNIPIENNDKYYIQLDQQVQNFQENNDFYIESEKNLSSNLQSQKRISICIQKQKSSKFKTQYKKNRNNDLIPLRQNNREQSMVIQTYRLLKNRYQNIEMQREKKEIYKKKNNDSKREQNRFKGTAIAYDYDGQPIPLRNYKRPQTSNFVTKTIDSITVIPLAQNIVLPSTLNKKRLEKRKARYLKQDQQKQNNRFSSKDGQSFKYSEGSDFIKKIPNDIKKNKLFNNQKQEQNYRKNSDQITFTQFKKNMDKQKTINNCVADIKTSFKVKLSNLSDVKQQSKVKIHQKIKINVSQGKVKMNQKLFEDIFKFKPNSILDEIQFQENDPLDKRKSQIGSKLYIMHNLQKQSSFSGSLKANKQFEHVKNRSQVNNSSLKKHVRYDSTHLYQKQKTSIFRHSLHNSPKKLIKRNYQSLNQSPKKANEETIFKLRQKMQKPNGSYRSLAVDKKYIPIGNKKKLKTRPSCKNLVLA